MPCRPLPPTPSLRGRGSDLGPASPGFSLRWPCCSCSDGASLLVGDGILALPDRLILLQIRLPRTLLAVLVGGGLGLSGAVLQGALRNPLADPGLLGITGTAGLGAALVFYWGLAAQFAPGTAARRVGRRRGRRRVPAGFRRPRALPDRR